ncbi:MAG: oligosaccharide flippase family protein, partial [Patescibacteria group bacterium]
TIWSTTWPIALSVAITLIYFRADTLIMSFFRSPEEVGLYGAAYRVLETMIQFPYLIMGSILPLLAKHFISDRKMLNITFQ